MVAIPDIPAYYKASENFHHSMTSHHIGKSLTDKLIGLLKYEIISITTINGNSTIELLGTNSLNNLTMFNKPDDCNSNNIKAARTNISMI